MEAQLVIVGAGIGGLSAALAWARRGREGTCRAAGSTIVLEQAEQFGELGAGLQLGPNAVRVLSSWGLATRLDELAAHPQALRVMDACDARELARMRLGRSFRERYGSDYLTLHRADLHGVLLAALNREQVTLRSASAVSTVAQTSREVMTTVAGISAAIRSPALVACDGVWSSSREPLLGDGAAPMTGHLAFRTMLDMEDVPPTVPCDEVSVWLGPRMHAVAYPVRAGQLMNLVVILQESGPAASGNPERRWDVDAGHAQGVVLALRGLDPALQDLAGAARDWKLWRLHDRAPMDGPHQMAQGRVALLGDAAHPMRPYMAQGAAMAIEDAWVLARELEATSEDPAAAFARYAQQRWRRAARVQRKSRMNGRIFHARGVVRVARNLALRAFGERLLDAPWLYGQRFD